jgi:hypothetical protein
MGAEGTVPAADELFRGQVGVLRAVDRRDAERRRCPRCEGDLHRAQFRRPKGLQPEDIAQWLGRAAGARWIEGAVELEDVRIAMNEEAWKSVLRGKLREVLTRFADPVRGGGSLLFVGLKISA